MGDHLIVLHSAARGCPGYSRHDAPSILLDGSSLARDTEHGRAITAQLTRRHGTLAEAIDAAAFALGAAGLSKGIQRQARAACEDYFYGRLELTPSHELVEREEIVETLEHELDHHDAWRRGNDPVDDEERAAIVDEERIRVGDTEAMRRASRAARGSVGEFLRRTWPLWLVAALVALAEAYAR